MMLTAGNTTGAVVRFSAPAMQSFPTRRTHVRGGRGVWSCGPV